MSFTERILSADNIERLYFAKILNQTKGAKDAFLSSTLLGLKIEGEPRNLVKNITINTVLRQIITHLQDTATPERIVPTMFEFTQEAWLTLLQLFSLQHDIPQSDLLKLLESEPENTLVVDEVPIRLKIPSKFKGDFLFAVDLRINPKTGLLHVVPATSELALDTPNHLQVYIQCQWRQSSQNPQSGPEREFCMLLSPAYMSWLEKNPQLIKRLEGIIDLVAEARGEDEATKKVMVPALIIRIKLSDSFPTITPKLQLPAIIHSAFAYLKSKEVD